MSKKFEIKSEEFDLILKDFDNINSRKKILILLSTEDSSFSCKNENGEDAEIHCANGSMLVKTYQENGFLRVDEYDSNGNFCGQWFEGRWKI